MNAARISVLHSVCRRYVRTLPALERVGYHVESEKAQLLAHQILFLHDVADIAPGFEEVVPEGLLDEVRLRRR